MRKAPAMLVAFAAAFLFCSAHRFAVGAKAKPAAAPAINVAPGNTAVTIETVKGPIVVELYTKKAPLTAGNFLKLARKGFYNGLAFHRVEPGFVIQSGDPYSKDPSDERIGRGGPGYQIKLEPSATKFKHERGVIAMARSGHPDSAGSQWYITLAPASWLDGGYAVFGKVLKGMDVADRIVRFDRIRKIVVQEKKPAAKSSPKLPGKDPG